jgi:hypothetical protein
LHPFERLGVEFQFLRWVLGRLVVYYIMGRLFDMLEASVKQKM